MSIAATATRRSAYRLTNRGVLAGEWTKFWSLRSTWITLAVSMFLLVAIGTIAAGTYNPDRHRPGEGPTNAVNLALTGSTLAVLVVGILGVLLAAGEYTTGMIRSTLVAVPTRLPVLWSKAAIAGGISLVAMSVCAVIAFLLGKPLVPASLGSLGLGGDGVLRALLGAGLYMGLVAMLGVALGILVRSSAGGIAILVAVLLIVPGLTSLLPDSWNANITPYLPSNAGGAIMSLTKGDNSLGPWTGLLVFAGYVVVALAVAAYRLAKSDA